MSLQNIAIGPKLSPSVHFVRVRFKTLEIPPVKDGVVLGRTAQIGAEAMIETLNGAGMKRFIRLSLADRVIADILIRESLLRKLDAEIIKQFVLEKIKPLMSETETLSFSVELETVIEEAW